MTTRPSGAWLDAKRAAAHLGVKRETLYAYASRGLVRSAPVAGSRTRRYHRGDLDRLRARREARSGHGAVAAGALRWGEPVLESAITRIDETGPAYRGHGAVALADEGVPFERVAELLWTGELPGESPRWRAADLGASVARLGRALPPTARPLDPLMLVATAVAAADADRHAHTLERHGALLRRLVAAFGLGGGSPRVRASLAEPTAARALLVALGARPSRRAAAAVDRALVLCADHELNPSSFAARVTASAGADDYACVCAALATLSGPVHGGATERVEALVEHAGHPERAVTTVRERLARGEYVPGFGHRLYPLGDPRAHALLADAHALGGRRRAVRTIGALVDAMELAGQPLPTLDAGLVALAASLGLGPGGALALFAAGRLAGWIAHAAEQRDAGFLLRPRARYVGA